MLLQSYVGHLDSSRCRASPQRFQVGVSDCWRGCRYMEADACWTPQWLQGISGRCLHSICPGVRTRTVQQQRLAVGWDGMGSVEALCAVWCVVGVLAGCRRVAVGIHLGLASCIRYVRTITHGLYKIQTVAATRATTYVRAASAALQLSAYRYSCPTYSTCIQLYVVDRRVSTQLYRIFHPPKSNAQR